MSFSLWECSLLPKAPSSLPAQNPVSVSVELDTGRSKQVLISTIKVIDSVAKYEGTFSGSVKVPTGFHQINTTVRLVYEPRGIVMEP